MRWTPGSHRRLVVGRLWPYKGSIGKAGKTAARASHPGRIPLRGVRSLTPPVDNHKNVMSICSINSSASLSKSIDSPLPIVRGVSLQSSHSAVLGLSCSIVGSVGVWCRGMIGAF